MHPISSIISGAELRQQEFLATAVHAERCSQANGSLPRPNPVARTWVLPVIVVATLVLIATLAGGDPAAIVQAIDFRR